MTIYKRHDKVWLMPSRIVFYFCSLSLYLYSPNLYALCGEPQPRLVCAEATSSKAVVIARFVSRRFVPSRADSDLNIYTLERIRLLRGDLPQRFVIHERNDSGRSGVDWKTGQQYLLFVYYNKPEHANMVEACSNSGLLNKTSKVISEVEALESSQAKPLVSGLISTDSWDTGIPGAEITALGPAGIFSTRSGSDGRFELRVEPGVYSVTANAPDWAIAAGPFSYENPNKLHLSRGTCAQVHFEGSPSKQ